MLLEISGRARSAQRRTALGVAEAWEGVHVSGTENSSYYYSTYNAEDRNPVHSRSVQRL